MTELKPQVVEIVREVNWPPERVYAAWTDPAQMQHWLAPVVESDPRIGGRFRIEGQMEGVGTMIFVGDFQVLEPGRKVRMSWEMENKEMMPFEAIGEYVEVTFEPLDGDRTRMTLVNAWTGPDMSAEDTANASLGWNGWLDGLDKLAAGEPVYA